MNIYNYLPKPSTPLLLIFNGFPVLIKCKSRSLNPVFSLISARALCKYDLSSGSRLPVIPLKIYY